ncbi:class I SAM-dependent methyltransferase [Candidatus Parcubacteria bacterium]|nr:class I SAM-dependent methyltransferase [Candidatus Parcubacteria bacterium]
MERDIMHYYEDDYQPYDLKYNVIAEKVIEIRTKREARLFKSFNPTVTRLLDVGSSWGKYMIDMKQFGGFKVTGVEFNKKMCEKGRQMGLDIRHGNLEDQQFAAGSFDVVVMSHVIEHLYDPLSTLREVNRILSAEGIVFIKTPNTKTAEFSFFRSVWFSFEAPRHIIIFNEKNLLSLLDYSDFFTRKVEYDRTPNAIIMSFNYFFIRIGAPKAVSDFFSINNYILLGLFTPISFLLALFRSSGRITVLAQKK